MRSNMAILLFICFMLSFTSPVFGAEKFPIKPITVMIPWSPGGGTDVVIRLIEKDFLEEFGQPLVFVYKPGADGAVGHTELARSKPDGYTICPVLFPLLLMNKLRGVGAYALDDFDYLGSAVIDDVLYVVNKDSDIKSMQQLIEKAKAAPGKISIGTMETLGPSFIPSLRLMQLGVPMNLVPFQSGAKSIPALLGNHVTALAAVKSVAMPSLPHLRVLAAANKKRDTDFPEIPTLQECGYDVTSFLLRGFFAPKGLDPKVKTRLEEGIKRIYDKPEVIAKHKEFGLKIQWTSGGDVQKMFNNFQKTGEEVLSLSKKIIQ